MTRSPENPELDLLSLDDEEARLLVKQFVVRFDAARDEVKRAQSHAAGIRKFIEALVEMYPATEDELPDTLDDNEVAHPRGAEAAVAVLRDHPETWFTVLGTLDVLAARGWMPRSAYPANAVRTALERLIEQGRAEKSKTEEGVVYRALAEASEATP